MRSTTSRLRVALSLALATPDDRSLLIALAVADSPAYAPSTGSSSPQDDQDPEATRLRALVDLAKEGDAEAFGQLYDHYVTGVFRFVYYRVGSQQLAEDLTSETFVRGLRAIQRFNWQGKDFGAWLTTIARNLVADHFKSSRARLEIVAETIPEGKVTVPSPEQEVLALISNEMLFEAVNALPKEQRDCILMRFIQGLSIAQTAAALGRSEGAIKQLQLRAVRSLAKTMPEDAR
ncbi:sigma-70 family RNA polymerase sigma factor [Aeromicrobium ginsengisoli]|uniref:Sigma-70 family RNA polymerase sigma factor n=1 Tax=Aeromicrobium ginsengisoli TaxID=363867 RepID=A0A5M4FCW3_9ACTN|nr:sigma-70 family RNA polymerase sigma factor [Aeromicrobium ginsengisoli]KAA1397175.1 sigma-70 family RNA polymerase sigma factor [Aeromicrobium ginsengisoli]